MFITKFQEFSFWTLWTPDVIIGLAAMTILFHWLLTKPGRGSVSITVRQKIYFGLALLCLYLGWGSPLSVVGHSVFSVHMIQMVFVYFAGVPLLLLAIPKWLLQVGIKNWKRKSMITYRFILNPILGLIGFNALFSFYHFPVIFDYMMQVSFLQIVFKAALFSSAALMWWHILAPLPELNRFTDFRRIIYIFANGILITPACALMIFAGSPLYETYTNPETMMQTADSFRFLDAHQDQRLAGIIMKISQEFIYASAIGYVFKQWLNKEKQQDGELTISDIPDSHYANKKNRF
ncbi:cytochrome c oxidase assembly protein [Salibacterium qingdaonense]|uniref:Putative membrane protein n=1 Tax=Salibacterium qingdaonense TaxID=266892 RepID=A0A1I4INT4_9BACI|nr:cytochrome c oxidase assembly protein [Salibacterium qingdaonense]SFL55461.1 putative membrane protein [Salibacterium qingdaonense]